MEQKTKENIYAAFAGEAKAYFRLLAYADKAEDEEFPQIAHLFRVIAEAERIHATKNLNLVKDIIVSDTDTNLQNSFNREKTVSQVTYPRFIMQAKADGEETVATLFSFARDAEDVHLKLYEKALNHTIRDEKTVYFLCEICGYISDTYLPDKCPVCGAPKDKFKEM